MRILYVGSAGGLENTGRFYLYPPRLINGLIRNNHQVYIFNDKDVARSSNLFRSSRLGIDKTNDHLIKTCRDYLPQLIILAHCQFIQNETLDKIRTICKDVKIIHLNVDPISYTNNKDKIKYRIGHVDCVFVTTAGESLREISSPDTFATFIPNPTDKSIDTSKAFANTQCQHDLFFASNAMKEDDHRKLLVEKIMMTSPHIIFKIIGSGINNEKLFGMNYITALNDTKMGLVINKTEDFYLYASDRMSQYMANGLMVFAHQNPRYTDIFQDGEIVSYENGDELIDKMNYYHTHDSQRIKIAEKGYTKIHQIFDSTLVARYMVDTTMKNKLDTYAWPTEKYFGKNE